jgi:hypothetical protein
VLETPIRRIRVSNNAGGFLTSKTLFAPKLQTEIVGGNIELQGLWRIQPNKS